MFNVKERHMLNRDKVINVCMWCGGVIAFILLSLMVAPAIKFFFRVIYVMMQHPIEALSFVGLVTTLLFVAIRVSEK